MLLPGGHTRRKTDRGIGDDNVPKRLITAPNPLQSSESALGEPFERPTGCLNVQQVLAGELRLVGNEGEPRLGLGAHQALDGIGGALPVVGQ